MLDLFGNFFYDKRNDYEVMNLGDFFVAILHIALKKFQGGCVEIS